MNFVISTSVDPASGRWRFHRHQHGRMFRSTADYGSQDAAREAAKTEAIATLYHDGKTVVGDEE